MLRVSPPTRTSSMRVLAPSTWIRSISWLLLEPDWVEATGATPAGTSFAIAFGAITGATEEVAAAGAPVWPQAKLELTKMLAKIRRNQVDGRIAAL